LKFGDISTTGSMVACSRVARDRIEAFLNISTMEEIIDEGEGSSVIAAALERKRSTFQ
jgi:hypothetical protein